MQHMWHPGGSGLAILALLAAACGGGEDSRAAATAEETTEDGNEPSQSALQFAIDGRSEPLGAHARLDVLEGIETVHLGITWADSGSDVIVIDVEFAGLDSAMGSHVIPLGLPDRDQNHANASLDSQLYYSQSGEVELTLSEQGSIEGRFNFLLAEDQAVLGDPLQPLEASDDAMPLTGDFHGKWILSCRSRFPGHESYMAGGVFCENLEL